MTTSTSPRDTTRRALRGLAPALVLGSLVLAGPAHADIPVGWTEPAEVSAMDMLLVLVAAPIGAVVLVGLLALLPGFVRGEGFTGRSAHADDQWFGGPRHGTAALPAAGDDQEPGDQDRALTGGAGGTW